MNRWFFACVPVALIGCGMVQEFGPTNDGSDGGASNDAAPNLPNGDGDSGVAPTAPTFSWLNPLPTGNDLLGIWGTADDDVWVAGEHGTVARWDGTKASLVYDGKLDEEFYALWGSSKDDMWIGGRAGTDGKVMHWDGKSWSSSFALAGRSIHSLWGSSSNDVWALADDGAFAHFDGTTFGHAFGKCEHSPSVLRDLWGSSSVDIWAVGDNGGIYHYQPKVGADPRCWTRAERSATGLTDPFAKDNAYFGIWGSSANDVWAAFYYVTPGWFPSKIGFSHFDGTAWRVTQLESISDLHEISREPARRGHRVWGSSANDILAIAGYSTWRWNGTTWTKSTVEPRDGGYDWKATWGSASRGFMAVAQSGSWGRLDADQRWSQVVPTPREDLVEVSVAPDRSVWALSGGREAPDMRDIVRWTKSGWTAIPKFPLALQEGYVDVSRFKALSNDDLWVAGTKRSLDGRDAYGYVVRFTNGAWGAVQRVLPWGVSGFDVASPTDAWVVDRNNVARWDGTTWRRVPLPSGLPSDDSAFWLSDVKIVSGDVWISGDDGAVLRWDGTSLLQAYKKSRGQFRRIWASGPNDVWVSGSSVLHYDGSTWTPSGEMDFSATNIWGSGPDDVWLISNSVAGGIARNGSTVRHWDGTSLSTVLEVSSSLQSVSGRSKDDVWLVGDEGATVRYATKEWQPPR